MQIRAKSVHLRKIRALPTHSYA